MADRADRLAGLDEAAHEADRVLVAAQEVGIGDPAGQHEAVVVGGVGVGNGLVDLDLVAVIEVLERLHLAVLERDQLDLGARLLDGVEWLLQLDLLDSVRKQEGDLLAVQVLGHVPLLS